MNCDFSKLSPAELTLVRRELEERYAEFQSRKLKLNMARGKPGAEQLDISDAILESANPKFAADGTTVITYTAKVSVEDYDAEVTNAAGSSTITLSCNPSSKFYASVNWVGDEAVAGNRPTNMFVQLYADGVAYVIHNGDQEEREEDYLYREKIVGHYRFDASLVDEAFLIPWEGED